MVRFSGTLTALILSAMFIPSARAQEPKATPTPTVSGEAEKDPPKGEVDLAFEELKKRGEKLVTLCGDKCKDPKHVITGGVINGKAIELVTPVYPAIARSAHVSGQVVVLVIIDKDGNVMAAQIVDGHPLLRVAAIKAAKASKFTPTLLEGKPVNILGEIIYNFVAAP